MESTCRLVAPRSFEIPAAGIRERNPNVEKSTRETIWKTYNPVPSSISVLIDYPSFVLALFLMLMVRPMTRQRLCALF
jgi:hypothetical protein